jgi:hypothetical protein
MRYSLNLDIIYNYSRYSKHSTLIYLTFSLFYEGYKWEGIHRITSKDNMNWLEPSKKKIFDEKDTKRKRFSMLHLLMHKY